jgi:acyl-CoA reductase-like NAD-dependent aldehyde dehydrogenase
MELASAKMTIGGRKVEIGSSFEVVNPVTEAPWAVAAECTRQQLDEAFAAAAAAQPAWARDEERRKKTLGVMADVLRRNIDELAVLLTKEQGKTVADSKLEIEGAAQWYDYYADLDVPAEGTASPYPTPAGPMEVRTLRHPLGVVAAITPWNFPLALAAWKLGPALRAGNTVVLKPSPYTPIATLRFGELLAEAVPAGVLNVVSGGDDLGAWMTTHPVPSKVSFTGSVQTGKAVARAVADDLKRVTLELGGNDPAVLLDDIDPAAVAVPLFWGSFYNNGQICGAIKRVYVHERQFEALANELGAIASTVRVGDGMMRDTVQGPINNRMQYDRVNELLRAAISDGGRVRCGGQAVGDRGFFLTPAVVTDIPEQSRLVTEEQFGPVLPLIPYRDLDAAIAAANDTKFGLGSSVWSADQGRARDVGRQLECGTTWINSHAVMGPGAPFGGAKWSGIGVEGGLEGVYSFTQLQAIHEPA